MVILAVSTWHAHPKLLHEQILNYNSAFDGEVVHMININSDFTEKFWAETARLGINFKKIENVYFTERPARTYWAGIAHAFFVAVQDAIRRKIHFDYIYCHTSADLLVKPGINKFIYSFDIGFKKTTGWPLEYKTEPDGTEMITVPKTIKSFWKESIEKNMDVGKTLRVMGAESLYHARSEGCFFSRDIFFEIMFPLISSTSVKEMEFSNVPYPIEEFMFAQCVEFFCDRNNVRRTENVIVTSQNDKQQCSIEDIDAAIETSHKFGVKRFDTKIESPQREYIRKLMGLSRS